MVSPVAAIAQNEFIATEGDWFDPASWSTGQIPSAGDAVEISNDGTARADVSSPFYPGAGTAIEAGVLIVGGLPDGGVTRSGVLETAGIDLSVEELLVGDGATGRVNVRGSVLLEANARVGRGLRENGRGDGVLHVEGDLLTQTLGATLEIGTAQFGGMSAALADVGGDILGFISVDVGGSFESFTPGGAPNHVDATLHVGGDLQGRSNGGSGTLRVGGGNEGTAIGRAIIDGDVTASLQAGLAQGNTDFPELGSGTGSIDVGGDLLRGGIVAGSTFTGHGVSNGRVAIAGDATDSRFVLVGVVEATLGRTQVADEAHGVVTVGGTMASTTSGMLMIADPGLGGVATGSVEAEALSGYRDISVGVVFRGDASASAKGRLVVRSGGVRRAGFRFDVGLTGISGGSSVGYVEIAGEMDHWQQIRVGHGYSGTADGTLILSQGLVTARDMSVGIVEGGATVTGRVHLDRYHVGLDEGLTLGDGSTLAIELHGLMRGIAFGAIDAELAALDGDLELIFHAGAGPGIYDLIVSGGMDNISGAFDAVTITGIDPTLVAFGTEVVSVGGKRVEVFRARVIPEPTTGALLALGILVLAVGRPRRVRASTPTSEVVKFQLMDGDPRHRWSRSLP